MNPKTTLIGCGLALTALAFSGCSGGTKGDPGNRGPFAVSLISTGLGQIFPYRIRQADSFGNPTQTVLNIDTIDVLKSNLGPNNIVLPTATFGTTALLPDGSPGNQFIHVRFTHNLISDGNFVGLDSVLSNDPANQTNSGLTTSISLLEYDPFTDNELFDAVLDLDADGPVSVLRLQVFLPKVGWFHDV